MKLNSKKIKLIAVVCMLVDHLICQYYGPQYFCIRDQLSFRIMQPFDPYPQLWGLAGVLSDGVSFLLSVLGRMAAVLFFFLLAEGFSHTRSVKKYIVRLLAFGAAAQIGYTLFDEGKLVPFNEMRFNIMFTMAAALFALWCVQKLKGRPYLAVPAALGVTAATVALDLEYSYQCVAYVFFFYYGKKLKAYQRAILGVLLACGLNVYRLRRLITETGMRSVHLISIYAVGHILAVLLTLAYNGEKGKQSKAFQYFFYAFYPAHLLILGVLQVILYRFGQ